jgi:hypothetical protein
VWAAHDSNAYRSMSSRKIIDVLFLSQEYFPYTEKQKYRSSLFLNMLKKAALEIGVKINFFYLLIKLLAFPVRLTSAIHKPSDNP